MTSGLNFRGAHWILLAVLALAPVPAFAQQDDSSGDLEPQDPGSAEVVAAVPEDAETPEIQGKDVQEEDAREENEAAGAEESQEETGAAEGDTGAREPATDAGPKVISGMSILGNQEAPTSLVIVPWKSSQIGNSVGISTMLDDSRQPVDKEVFMRELRYYEIRSETQP